MLRLFLNEKEQNMYIIGGLKCICRAYWSFRSHFPEQADSLLNSLDSSYKRVLNGELTLSNSSSSNSLHQQGVSSTSRYGVAGTAPRVRLTNSATGKLQWGRT